MPIEFNAREFAVSDRSAWSTNKTQIFGLLKIKSIETVAGALRLGKQPPRHLNERYTEPNGAHGRKSRRRWLMASRVARTTDGWEITVVYFGPERDVPLTELTAGDVLHSEKVLHEEYSTRWRGQVFVVEAVPGIGTPPSPLHNADHPIVRALIHVARSFMILLQWLLAIGNLSSIRKSFAVLSMENLYSIFYGAAERFNRKTRETKLKEIKIAAEIDAVRNRENRNIGAISVAADSLAEGIQRAASMRPFSQPSSDLLASICRQTDDRLSLAKYSPNAFAVTSKAAFQSTAITDASIDRTGQNGAGS